MYTSMVRDTEKEELAKKTLQRLNTCPRKEKTINKGNKGGKGKYLLKNEKKQKFLEIKRELKRLQKLVDEFELSSQGESEESESEGSPIIDLDEQAKNSQSSIGH